MFNLDIIILIILILAIINYAITGFAIKYVFINLFGLI